MEIGYEDKPQPLTFEALENKFQDEIRKLILEQTHAEDAENYRHREKLMEINNKYQEKLSALRAQQASRREEFLRKESEERLGKYQQSSMIRTSSTNLNNYVGPEVHRAYPSGYVNQFDSYGVQPQRSRRTVGRVPYPQGRVYNNTGAHFE